MGLFSSSSKKSYSTSYSKTSDARVGVDQGTAIGAGAAVGGGGFTSSVGDMSTVTQSFDGASFRSGLTGDDVLGLLQQQAATTRTSQDAAGKFSELALTALSAAEAGQSVDWKQYIPIGIVAAIAIAALRRRKA